MSTPKKIGFGGAVGIAVGTTIGGGLFAFTIPAAKEAGSSLPWAFVLGIVPALLALAPIAMLASALPTAGGNYKYPSRILSPGVAFLGAWTFAIGAVFGFFPLYALNCVDYLGTYLPSLPERPAAAVILTVCFAINLIGLRLATAVEAFLVAVLIIALVVFAGLGVSHIAPENLAIPNPRGAVGMISGASLLTFAYLGSNSLIELGHEIEKPARTIPRAMLLCLVLVLALYVLVGLVTVGVVPWDRTRGSDLVTVAKVFMEEPLIAFFVVGGAVTALGTSLNAAFIWGTKSLQVLCNDGFLPQPWGRSHPRWGTPYRILTGIWALSMVGLWLPFDRVTLNVYATLGGLFIVPPVLVASMLLPRRCPQAYAASKFRLRGPFLYLAPSVGILIIIGAMVTLIVDLADRSALILFGVWVIAGCVYAVKKSNQVDIPSEEGWC